MLAAVHFSFVGVRMRCSAPVVRTPGYWIAHRMENRNEMPLNSCPQMLLSPDLWHSHSHWISENLQSHIKPDSSARALCVCVVINFHFETPLQMIDECLQLCRVGNIQRKSEMICKTDLARATRCDAMHAVTALRSGSALNPIIFPCSAVRLDVWLSSFRPASVCTHTRAHTLARRPNPSIISAGRRWVERLSLRVATQNSTIYAFVEHHLQLPLCRRPLAEFN